MVQCQPFHIPLWNNIYWKGGGQYTSPNLILVRLLYLQMCDVKTFCCYLDYSFFLQEVEGKMGPPLLLFQSLWDSNTSQMKTSWMSWPTWLVFPGELNTAFCYLPCHWLYSAFPMRQGWIRMELSMGTAHTSI